MTLASLYAEMCNSLFLRSFSLIGDMHILFRRKKNRTSLHNLFFSAHYPHYKRVIITPKGIQLARRIRGWQAWTLPNYKIFKVLIVEKCSISCSLQYPSLFSVSFWYYNTLLAITVTIAAVFYRKFCRIPTIRYNRSYVNVVNQFGAILLRRSFGPVRHSNEE